MIAAFTINVLECYPEATWGDRGGAAGEHRVLARLGEEWLRSDDPTDAGPAFVYRRVRSPLEREQ